jgi:hypothetical protein
LNWKSIVRRFFIPLTLQKKPKDIYPWNLKNSWNIIKATPLPWDHCKPLGSKTNLGIIIKATLHPLAEKKR